MALAVVRKEAEAPRIMSIEARAQLVADAIGMVSQGDYRKRVFEEAERQITNAVAVALSFERNNPGAFRS